MTLGIPSRIELECGPFRKHELSYQPNSAGLQPDSNGNGLHPECDGLQPESDGLVVFYILVVSDERRMLVTQALQNGSKSWRSSRPPIFQLLD